MTGSPAPAEEREYATVQAPSGQLTEIIASALGPAAEAARAQWPDDTDEIQAITDAMVRLLTGVPLRSDGQLTIKSLAEEAGLRRNKLTHKHTGLKDLFYALVRAQNIRPKDTERLQQERDELAEALKQARRERNELREEVKRLVRIIHVLEVENDNLKTTSGARGGTVRVLPQRSAPPPSQR
ncbi:hypothetical protein [Streptomyces sp. PAM3C]|uniref:hypothetical protein n=1 Tax=Streptomyces sp. PAM3C TaxID=2847300 RepID=UPI001C1DF6A9|nr:hypothetical protein [Streptomyces sp. PAM3C]MBU5945992.1 hypothetical protein [Streptomyces sp. PAM3C]